MPALALPSFAILLAIALSIAMSIMSIFIVFTHQERQEEIDSWLDYSFSREMLGRAFHYYRWIGVSMIVVYVMFTISCLLLQAEGYVIFSDGKAPVTAGPFLTLGPSRPGSGGRCSSMVKRLVRSTRCRSPIGRCR